MTTYISSLMAISWILVFSYGVLILAGNSGLAGASVEVGTLSPWDPVSSNVMMGTLSIPVLI